MKLRNKKTGEIMDDVQYRNYSLSDGFGFRMNGKEWEYHSLAELNEEWEDIPEEPKEYWFIDYDGGMIPFYENEETAAERMMKQIGNYFETREEAEKAVEKIRAYKRLKDKGFRFMNNKVIGEYGNVSYRLNYPATAVEEKDLNLLFGGEE